MNRLPIFLLATAIHAGPTRPATATTQPCWERDAQPIIKRNCLGCHGPGSAMGNLSSPDSAHSRSNLIMVNLATGKMPMRGDLPTDDRSTLISWASLGAPRCP